MIFLIHRNASEFLRAIENGNEIKLKNSSVTLAFWELAENYPEDLIVWCEEEFAEGIEPGKIKSAFPHRNTMVSYAVKSSFFSKKIGYVDQLPFVNPIPKVRYATWLMSSDIGGIYGETALAFRKLFQNISNFEYLLNSIAKLGQQSSLFCYSDPNIIKAEQRPDSKIKASKREFFSFIAQHYKREWLWVLLFCFYRYEDNFPVLSFFSSFFKNSYFQYRVSIRPVIMESAKTGYAEESMDVIIPTLFRAEYVKNLLEDLRDQTKLPTRIIVVEQNPDPKAISELQFLKEEWPFEIIHHFVHQVGACKARNIALKEVKSKWVLFADDDIRISPDLIERSFEEIKRLDVDCLNLNSLQPGEKSVFPSIKQWGAFGSANALVKSEYALKCKFSNNLEYGFGEDIDFGMQLRERGCDIIYHPDLKFTHLKADRGGFRAQGINDWSHQEIEPKPSPTMMFLSRRYYTPEMMKGYKASLFLKFYRKQQIRNPFRYFRMMRERWRKSEELCDELQANKVS